MKERLKLAPAFVLVVLAISGTMGSRVSVAQTPMPTVAARVETTGWLEGLHDLLQHILFLMQCEAPPLLTPVGSATVGIDALNECYGVNGVPELSLMERIELSLLALQLEAHLLSDPGRLTSERFQETIENLKAIQLIAGGN
ncbi:MAG: hypothetical protein H7Y88_13430 [Phycisphaerales bacterium]|nr:hypothetical protein [Phycisphaerales bacterium]